MTEIGNKKSPSTNNDELVKPISPDRQELAQSLLAQYTKADPNIY